MVDENFGQKRIKSSVMMDGFLLTLFGKQRKSALFMVWINSVNKSNDVVVTTSLSRKKDYLNFVQNVTLSKI